MSSKQSRDPLLYIMQPTIRFPKATMQETFVVARNSQEDKKPLLNEEAKKKFDSELDSPTTNPAEAIAENKGNTVTLDKEKKVRKKVAAGKKNLESDEVQEIIHHYHQDQTYQEETPATKPEANQHSYSFKRVKSFREMNIMEKLNYLELFPKQLPPVPCIFMTKSSSIKGFLVQLSEDVIEIKQFNDKKVELLINEITDIKMIGLK